MATPRSTLGAQPSSSMSLRPSPTAMTRSRGMRSRTRTGFRRGGLVDAVCGNVEPRGPADGVALALQPHSLDYGEEVLRVVVGRDHDDAGGWRSGRSRGAPGWSGAHRPGRTSAPFRAGSRLVLRGH